MPPKNKYTDPKLRDEVKEEIHQGDKGGAPGQWSARKAQLMAAEYKKRGGEYTTDKKDQDESQQHLSKWTEEEWQTKDGSANAKQDDGTQKRYLPKKAWEEMNEEEKQATDEKKQKGSKKGKQFVANTKKAKESRQKANDEEDEKYAKKMDEEKSSAENAKDEGEGEEVDGKENSESENDEEKENQAPKGKKRGRPAKSESAASKKSKLGNAPAQQGSNKRLPKEGQQVYWKSLGWIEGEVVEIVWEQKEVEGKPVKATKDSPRVVLRSNSSGKVCVHKAEAIYFD